MPREELAAPADASEMFSMLAEVVPMEFQVLPEEEEVGPVMRSME
jgi:hypothetical protein